MSDSPEPRQHHSLSPEKLTASLVAVLGVVTALMDVLLKAGVVKPDQMRDALNAVMEHPSIQEQSDPMSKGLIQAFLSQLDRHGKQ